VSEDKIILGIDPGTTVMGYGLIHIKKKEISMLNFGIIQLKKIETHPDKLKRILERLNGLILEFKPDEMAIEAPFFGKNVQSMLKLGRAQGVAIAASLNHNVPYEEYSPRRIKPLQEAEVLPKSRWQPCYKVFYDLKRCLNILMLLMG